MDFDTSLPGFESCLPCCFLAVRPGAGSSASLCLGAQVYKTGTVTQAPGHKVVGRMKGVIFGSTWHSAWRLQSAV